MHFIGTKDLHLPWPFKTHADPSARATTSGLRMTVREVGAFFREMEPTWVMHSHTRPGREGCPVLRGGPAGAEAVAPCDTTGEVAQDPLSGPAVLRRRRWKSRRACPELVEGAEPRALRYLRRMHPMYRAQARVPVPPPARKGRPPWPGSSPAWAESTAPCRAIGKVAQDPLSGPAVLPPPHWKSRRAGPRVLRYLRLMHPVHRAPAGVPLPPPARQRSFTIVIGRKAAEERKVRAPQRYPLRTVTKRPAGSHTYTPMYAPPAPSLGIDILD